MKKLLYTAVGCIFMVTSYSQVTYLQYRVVPADREAEFVEKETKYWSKVAEAAVEKGQMNFWELWRKVGVTEEGAPNYVFVNSFESIDAMNPSAVWSEENVASMGIDPASVETNSFAPTAFDYWLQVESFVPGSPNYVIANYAMPEDRSAFIEENKSLWKPLHETNVATGNMGMKSWVCLSVIVPRGNNARFSALTVDGFDTMQDALKYMRYESPSDASSPWTDVISKSKMGDIMPDGFEYSILYELVKRVGPRE